MPADKETQEECEGESALIQQEQQHKTQKAKQTTKGLQRL